MMKKLQFKSEIKAPVEKVYRSMLGLDDKSTYEAWVSEFNPTSTFEGSWKKGEKIQFVGTDENGENGGMMAEIVENIPHQFVSIRTYGILKNGVEITAGPEVEQWVGGHENYFFEERNGITTVTVEIDIFDEYRDYFQEIYPKALNKLKSLIENS